MRNDPHAAYAFAKGAEVELPAWSARAGEPQTRTAQLRRPLDFAAVTDHSELFGEMEICTRSPGEPGYDSFQCRQMRTGDVIPGSFNPTAVAFLWGLNPILRPDGAGPLLPLCILPDVDCEAAAVSIWQAIQEAAEDHYEPCEFTTFIGYEYTAQPEFANLHRNVIFRNANVPERAISNVTTGGPHPTVLWEKLREECLEGVAGCDVLTIPHNANLSGGLMFPDPMDADEAAERAFFEPLTEIYQHKGSSECRYDRLAGRGVDTADELCTFEQFRASILGPQPNPPDIDEFPRRNMIRNVLKDGLVLAPEFEGINPFKYGLVGSTDSHNGDPGNTVERDFQGHGGTEDAPVAALIDVIRTGPGGLAVVWAEENSRDAIFEAMLRKETYGTSGTRPIVRFFGGWEYDTEGTEVCDLPDRVRIGYDLGVPMGADLPPAEPGRNPRFLVAALKDPDSAALERIQIVKGWVDAAGQTHEQVLDVSGHRRSGRLGVKPETCEPVGFSAFETESGQLIREIERTLSGTDGGIAQTRLLDAVELRPAHVDGHGAQGKGFNELCTVWEDEQFDPAQPAFYYARVLEAPTCRWSTLACKAVGVDPFASPEQCRQQAADANLAAVARGEIDAGAMPFDNCCLTEGNDPFMERTIQERAWTSPIWYEPGG